jgi:cold shock CspA family protein
MRCEKCGVDYSSSHFIKNDLICNECYEENAKVSKEQALSIDTDNKVRLDKGIIGTVKWFSKEKGYGFITIEENKDVYFNVKDIVGAKLPNNGDTVSLETKNGKKGLYAVNVRIIDTASNQRDDRIKCPHCSKRIVPRIIVGPPATRWGYGYTPEPKKSICPFCGGQIQSFSSSNCFIATAVYGEGSPELVILRKYRDEKLIGTKLGLSFVRIYYKVSPAIAALIIKKYTLRILAKWTLDKIVTIINKK